MSGDTTLAAYDRLAGQYAEAFHDHPIPGLDTFVAQLPAGARVLDLGCGPGMAAARMAAAGFDVVAIDGSARMTERAAAHPGVTALQATFDDIPALGTFDAVWASFSLLHAPRSEFPRHLRDLRAACAPGAPLALGMKLGQGEGPDDLDRHYAYYTEAELRDHLARAGFVPGDAITGADKGLAGKVEAWILIFAHA